MIRHTQPALTLVLTIAQHVEDHGEILNHVGLPSCTCWNTGNDCKNGHVKCTRLRRASSSVVWSAGRPVRLRVVRPVDIVILWGGVVGVMSQKHPDGCAY